MPETRRVESESNTAEEKVSTTTTPLSHFSFQSFSSPGYYLTDEKEVRLLHKGVDLLAAYYQSKYCSSIIRPKNTDDTVGEFMDLGEFLEGDDLQKIHQARAKGPDYRCTYILSLPGQFHNISLSYIVENKKEALLFIDTLGVNNVEAKEALKAYRKKNSIDIYTSEHSYQKDHNSCGGMSVILGRDMTAKNKNDEYELESLLLYLKTHSTKKEGLYYADLPLSLIKISQCSKKLSDAVNRQDKTIVNIHDGEPETIEDFRKRFKREVYSKSKDLTLLVDGYAIIKCVKYETLIVILFYLEQVKAHFLVNKGFELPLNDQFKFVKAAKERLNAVSMHFNNMGNVNRYLMELANVFLQEASAKRVEKPQETSKPAAKLDCKKPKGFTLFFNKNTLAASASVDMEENKSEGAHLASPKSMASLKSSGSFFSWMSPKSLKSPVPTSVSTTSNLPSPPHSPRSPSSITAPMSSSSLLPTMRSSVFERAETSSAPPSVAVTSNNSVNQEQAQVPSV